MVPYATAPNPGSFRRDAACGGRGGILDGIPGPIRQNKSRIPCDDVGKAGGAALLQGDVVDLPALRVPGGSPLRKGNRLEFQLGDPSHQPLASISLQDLAVGCAR